MTLLSCFDNAISPKHLTIIVKVTGNCNLRCQYCYHFNRNQAHSIGTIHQAILETIIRQAMSLSPRVRFIWHGGEPLLVGRDLFQQAIRIQNEARRPNQEIRNCIQTNGTLIDQSWIDFFLENDFAVGTSLDGPEPVHNAQRQFASHQGTFEEALSGIRLLQKNSVCFGLLTVVTSNNVHNAKDIYEFFIQAGLKRFDFLPCVETDRDAGKLSSLSVSPIEFATFMNEIFGLWFENNNPSIRIRYFDNVLRALLGGEPKLCKFTAGCSSFLAINSNGDVYICDNLMKDELRLENILSTSLQSILAGRKRADILRLIEHQKSEHCGDCKWLQACNGGCPWHWYVRNRDFSSGNYLCEARMLIFEHISRRVESLISPIVAIRDHVSTSI